MTLAQWRNLSACLLIAGLVGIVACDVLKRDWKTSIIGVCFLVANACIFLWK